MHPRFVPTVEQFHFQGHYPSAHQPHQAAGALRAVARAFRGPDRVRGRLRAPSEPR